MFEPLLPKIRRLLLALMSRPVVVKVLSAPAGQNTWLRKRFLQEMGALSPIDHPGVVGIFEVGKLTTGLPFLVMQHVEGQAPRQVLESGPLDPARVALILRQTGAALQAVHAIGVARRDLKPENIILQQLSDGTERVKLTDFGIAKIEKSEIDPDVTIEKSAGHGSVSGQFQGENSHASDIYALALIACEMAIGSGGYSSPPSNCASPPFDSTGGVLQSADRPGSPSEFCNQVADALFGCWTLRLWKFGRSAWLMP